jgi:transketolase C-terminal domain/subunit
MNKMLMKNVNERSDIVAAKNHRVGDGVARHVAEMSMNEEEILHISTTGPATPSPTR